MNFSSSIKLVSFHAPMQLNIIIKRFGENVFSNIIKRSSYNLNAKNLLPRYCSSCYSPANNHCFYQIDNRYYSKDIKIYTRKGDGGTSSLFTGERKPKDDSFFNALGTIDELSSNIGLAKEFAAENKHDYVEQLERIQCILQDIGTIAATPVPKLADEKSNERRKRIEDRISFNNRHSEELEAWIDSYTNDLPPLTNFILPGGGRVSAALHVCRTVCRRTERSLIPLVANDLIDNKVLIYINRLSDYLFTVARHATILDGKKETIYIRPKPPKESRKDKEISSNEMES